MVIKKIIRNFANINDIVMAQKVYKEHEEQIARYLKALGHPARIAIMQFLSEQKTCFFGDINDVLPISKATVSQHLTELKNAGLIQGEIISPKVKYCINKENWDVARSLIIDFLKSVNKKGEGCC